MGSILVPILNLLGRLKDKKLLNLKNAGLWKIVENIDNKTFKLDILQTLKDTGLITIFYPWKIHFAPNNPFPEQILPPGPPIKISAKMMTMTPTRSERCLKWSTAARLNNAKFNTKQCMLATGMNGMLLHYDNHRLISKDQETKYINSTVSIHKSYSCLQSLLLSTAVLMTYKPH